MSEGQPDMASIRELLRFGNYAAALERAAGLVDKQPELWEAYYLLGCACRGVGDLNNAQMALRGLLQAQPDHRPALRELAQVLELMDELEAAISVCRRLLSGEPGDSGALLKLGELYAALGQSAEAEAAWRAALEREPGNLSALLGAGHAARAQGRREEAVSYYRRGIEVDPQHGGVWHSLANLKDYRFSEDDMAAMENALAADGGEHGSTLSLYFALGKAHDDRAEFDAAWSCYQRGNALGQRLRPWDQAAHEAQVDGLIDAFAAAASSATAEPQAGPGPVFIVGLPRSGSTLVEQILASHSAVQGTRELPTIARLARSLRSRRDPQLGYPGLLAELQPADLGLLARDYLASATPHLGDSRPFFTDKMPNNFLHIGLIHKLFPQAPIVHVQRGPMDVCVANLRQHFARGQNFTYGEENIAHYHTQYQRLMAHWEAVLPGRVVSVDYEKLVSDPEPGIRALLDALQVPFERECLAFHRTRRAVQTASSEQVRQPIYTSAVGYWRHYERHLQALASLLQSDAGSPHKKARDLHRGL